MSVTHRRSSSSARKASQSVRYNRQSPRYERAVRVLGNPVVALDIRAEQIARGIQTAKEQGLGEWAVKVAGRSFVRVGS